MAELNEIISARLKEVFQGDTQEVVARKLNTTQGNVSKWVNGEQVPTIQSLFEITKAYNVSIDWMLGISNSPEVDGLVSEKITYEQLTRLLDWLISNGNIEVADVSVFKQSNADDQGDEDAEESEDVVKIEPDYNTDYVRIRDRVLSYLLRKRYAINNTGEEMLELWLENRLPVFSGLKLLKYGDKVEQAIDTHNWPTFKDGDWAEMVQKIATMSESELEAYGKSNEKEGNDNGSTEHS